MSVIQITASSRCSCANRTGRSASHRQIHDSQNGRLLSVVASMFSADGDPAESHPRLHPSVPLPDELPTIAVRRRTGIAVPDGFKYASPEHWWLGRCSTDIRYVDPDPARPIVVDRCF